MPWICAGCGYSNVEEDALSCARCAFVDDEQWTGMSGPDASRFQDSSALARLKTPFDELEDPDRTGRRGGSAADQHNIFDAEYNNVWTAGIKVLDDSSLAVMRRLKDECDPILRKHGWRVTELHEWTSGKCSGTCWPNGHGGGSIALVLRRGGELKPYRSILSVMLHEMTHIEMNSNNHGPPFQALCAQLHREHAQLHGPTRFDDSSDLPCGGVRTRRGQRRYRPGTARRGFKVIPPSSQLARKPPLKRGQKMIDGRTKEGKAAKQAKNADPRAAAAAAALRRAAGM